MGTKKTAKRAAYYREWYGAKGEDYNEQRRKRYAKDPKVREAANERAREYYQSRKKAGVPTEPRTMVLSTGAKVKVWTSAQVAERINRNVETLRQWERRGLIPEPTISGKRRLYVFSQVRIVEKVAHLLRNYNRVGSAVVEQALPEAQKLHQGW